MSTRTRTTGAAELEELRRRVGALERWRSSSAGSVLALATAIATAVAAFYAHGGP
jgi:hypothetical protein